MSFILIGFGKQTFKDLGETGTEQQCLWCTTTMFYHLIRIRTWFTYFLIPVFPYRSVFRIECPACCRGVEIHGQEIKAAKQGELRLSLSQDTE
jgi:hypothetical protein